YSLERGEPLVDVTADQQLQGRAPLQFKRLRARGERHRLEKGAGCIGPTSGACERIAQARAKDPDLARRPRPESVIEVDVEIALEIERAAIERGRALEREHFTGSTGSLFEEIRCAIREIRAKKVRAEHFRISVARGFEHDRQPVMME